MKPPEMTKTVLDMEAPRFDVGGDRITGEFDEMKTPELEIVDVTEDSEYDSIEITELHKLTLPWREFWIGVAIGVVLAAIGFAIGWTTR